MKWVWRKARDTYCQGQSVFLQNYRTTVDSGTTLGLKCMHPQDYVILGWLIQGCGTLDPEGQLKL